LIKFCHLSNEGHNPRIYEYRTYSYCLSYLVQLSNPRQIRSARIRPDLVPSHLPLFVEIQHVCKCLVPALLRAQPRELRIPFNATLHASVSTTNSENAMLSYERSQLIISKYFWTSEQPVKYFPRNGAKRIFRARSQISGGSWRSVKGELGCYLVAKRPHRTAALM